MHAFDYQRPTEINVAVEALKRSQASKPLAGGMSLVPVMRHRLANPSLLVDLGAIQALGLIEDVVGGVRIGATTTHFNVSRSDVVKKKIPAIVQLAGGIGDPLVRNRGTIGGSLAHNDPAACYPSAILGLGATIHTNTRDIPADEFIVGTFTTALEAAEIIVGVSFPQPDSAAYIKFINASSRFSIVGIFLSRRAGRVLVGITGAGHHAFRATPLEDALGKTFTPAAARAVRIPAERLLTDTNASAEYRAYLIPELAARAVEHCLAGTPGAIV
jgi:carbon-monoxide dehydrogenase medium subunit